MVGDLALRVYDGEVFFFYEIELQQLVFAEVTMKSAHHIFIFELSIGGVVVDDRE